MHRKLPSVSRNQAALVSSLVATPFTVFIPGMSKSSNPAGRADRQAVAAGTPTISALRSQSSRARSASSACLFVLACFFLA